MIVENAETESEIIFSPPNDEKDRVMSNSLITGYLNLLKVYLVNVNGRVFTIRDHYYHSTCSF